MKSPVKSRRSVKRSLTWGLGFVLTVIVVEASASGATTLGGMASSIIGSIGSLSKLVTAGSYVGGLGFSVGAIMKFKAHKDNPTQIPIGTPLALTFIAAALLFLPSILGIAGGTMFGTTGTVAGPSGTLFGTS